MKWIGSETHYSKQDRQLEWNKWFAWFPVVVGYEKRGSKTKKVRAWFEIVERRRPNYYDNFKYREIKDDKR